MSYDANLPVELLLDILYRLPAKSLCRFKCVAKSWYSLISNPNFAKTHLDRNNTTTPESLLLISDHLFSVDCTEASINDSLLATKLDLGLPPIDPYLFHILGSCNGLVLVLTEVVITEVTTMLSLLNPLTRESQRIPESHFDFDSSDYHTMYGLGYDSSADDYKVVEIDIREPDYDSDSDDDDESFCNRASVYSLKTDSWRRIQDVPDYFRYGNGDSYEPPTSLVLVNGCLHWFGCRDYRYVIAAFDLADEKFPEVQIPSSLDNSKIVMECCNLGVLGGCLCLLVPQYSDTTEIWVMKEYGVIESWTKFTSVCGLDMYMTKFLCFVDGEVLLEVDGHNKFVAFNAKEKTRRDIVVCGIPTMFKAGQTYVESLVSPDHCVGKEKLKVYQLDSDTRDGESHLGVSHFEEHYQRHERKVEEMIREQREEMDQMRKKMRLEMDQMREQVEQIQSLWAQHANYQSCPSGSTSVPSTENFEGANCELLHYNGMGSVVATGEVVSLDPIVLVNDAPLSSDCWEVRVNYVFEPEVPLYRAHPSYFFLRHAIGNSIAWPSKYIKITGPSG